MKIPSKYIGVHEAIVVTVLEGDGTEENPWTEVQYIIEKKLNGEWVTRGKIAQLDNK